MKRSCVYVCVILGAFIVALFAGSILSVEKALASPNACPTPTATNYKKCSDCQCKVLDVTPGNKVTTHTVQAVLKCTKTASCFQNVAGNAKYDLNNDGKINTTDYRIAQKCLGCCSTPSPFK
jgi:hypothetical protein